MIFNMHINAIAFVLYYRICSQLHGIALDYNYGQR